MNAAFLPRTLPGVVLAVVLSMTTPVIAGSKNNPSIMPNPLPATVSYSQSIECASYFALVAAIALEQKNSQVFDRTTSLANRFLDTASFTHKVDIKKVVSDMSSRQDAMQRELESKGLKQLNKRYLSECQAHLRS